VTGGERVRRGGRRIPRADSIQFGVVLGESRSGFRIESGRFDTGYLRQEFGSAARRQVPARRHSAMPKPSR